MGTWDFGVFDDDTAYDCLDEIRTDPRGFFCRAFARAVEADDVDFDLGHAVTVSAAYVDNHLNGTTYRTDNADAKDETNVNLFKELRPDLRLDDLRDVAVSALRKVIGESSELNRLWSGNQELYPKWRGNLEALMERLKLAIPSDE
jgi:hypothetical protein